MNETMDTTVRKAIFGAMLRGALVGLLLFAVFAAGWFVRGEFVRPGVVSAKASYLLLNEVQSYLDQDYVHDQPPQKQLEYGAITGLLATLNDKYTFFVPPVVAKNESNALAGEYGGIGVEISRDGQGNFLLSPYPDSPAIKAGVKEGDRLIKVADKDVTPASNQDDVQQAMRGEVKSGNGVTITVVHPGDAGTQATFTIAFANIQVPSVLWHVLNEAPTIGYIKIKEFTSRTPDELQTALKDLRSQNITSTVLDLRNNPGGLLDESIKVASQFLDGGPVLYEQTRGESKTYTAEGSGLMRDLPLVILINNGTASAAEVVAGALQDRNRATLIGQTSYGKGSVQLIIPLSDGSSLHVTTAEWLTPNRISLNSNGLKPNVPMIPDPKGADVELAEAIRVLRDHKT
ncbi:MAG TPA: S41 family peptidase [Aggregatilineales bacterium]|nr:S41 family peptidase [Aggregatilineales bacterium]